MKCISRLVQNPFFPKVFIYLFHIYVPALEKDVFKISSIHLKVWPRTVVDFVGSYKTNLPALSIGLSKAINFSRSSILLLDNTKGSPLLFLIPLVVLFFYLIVQILKLKNLVVELQLLNQILL